LQEARGEGPVAAPSTDLDPVTDTGRRPRSPYPVLALVAALVIVFDQVTKELALRSLHDGPVDVIDGVLRWRLTFNPGGAFGILQDHPELFLVATVVVIGALVIWARKIDDPRLVIPLGLIVGGGLGNVIDRIVRGHDGQVVDFIDLHVWPVFNVADMAVVTGVGLILLFSFTTKES
jgi:signal peptidase II